MRFPNECYQIQKVLEERMPSMSPAQVRGLALWVHGTVLAKSGCLNAVITVLLAFGRANTIRQYLKEWLRDGADRAAPCQTRVDVRSCFGDLTRWVLSLWTGRELALAVDPTSHHDRVVSLTVSALYRSCAIPLVWHIVPANQEGSWMDHIVDLLMCLGEHVPRKMNVLVMADRGLWSPRLWEAIQRQGWHPLLRLQNDSVLRPKDQRLQRAVDLLDGPGSAWVGRGTVFRDAPQRQIGTIVLIWDKNEKEPWVLFTDLPPKEVGVWSYGLRTWIELGFRVLKSVGWQWQHTRRTDPDRVARHWLVLAVATLWAMASGTRDEDSERLGVKPSQLRKCPNQSTRTTNRPRLISVFARGVASLQRQLSNRRLWRNLWLSPEPWPTPPPEYQLIFQRITQSSA